MNYLIYGFSLVKDQLLKLTGVKNQTVFYITSSNITVAVSNFSRDIKLTELDYLRFFQVIDTLSKRYWLLPVKFGVVLANAEAIQRIIDNNKSALNQELERLAGCREFSIKLIWPLAELKTQAACKQVQTDDNYCYSPGGDYLIKKKKRYQVEDLLNSTAIYWQKQLENPMVTITQQVRADINIRNELFYQGYFLVRDERRNDFSIKAQNIKKALPKDFKFYLSGPWPPYNFINLSLEFR